MSKRPLKPQAPNYNLRPDPPDQDTAANIKFLFYSSITFLTLYILFNIVEHLIIFIRSLL